MSLFEGIRNEISDTRSSTSNISLAYNPTSNASPTGMHAGLVKYYNYQILRSVEFVDVIQFGLLDFW